MQRQSIMGSIFAVSCFLQGPAIVVVQDEGGSRAQKRGPAELAIVENIEDKTPFRVVAMIRDLPAANGAVADLDGDGDPISLRRIPVFEKGQRRERYCVYFRPWKVGHFLELKPR